MPYFRFNAFCVTYACSIHKLALKYILLLISLFLFLPDLATGQDYRFTHYDIEDGLSQNTVTDIFHDSEGYLWFGTQDGLNRFDGYEFSHYKHIRGDSASISDNYVWSITEDTFGNLWMCTRNGINRFDKNSQSFTSFELSVSSILSSIRIIDDVVWGVVNDGNIYRIPLNASPNILTNTIDDYLYTSLPEEFGFLQSIINHSNFGKIVLSNKGIILLDEDSSNFIATGVESFPLRSQHSMMIETKNEELYVGTSEGLFVYNHQAKKLDLTYPELGFQIRSIEYGPRQKLWVATADGIKILDEESVHVTGITPFNETATQDLTSADIHVIYKDHNETLWIGVDNKGLYKYDPAQEQFKFISQNTGLQSPIVWSIKQLEEDEYWIGTSDGISKIKLKPGVSFTSNVFARENLEEIAPLNVPEIRNKRINVIFSDENNTHWIGTHGDGIYLLNQNNIVKKHITFENEEVYSNQITSVVNLDGEFWVTTFGGIFLVDADYNFKERLSLPEHFSQYFFEVIKDSEQNLWLGSNNGFYRYETETRSFTLFPFSDTGKSPGFNFVNQIEENSDNTFWLATFGGGIDLFNPNSGTFKNYGEGEGLANNVVASIETDSKENVWIATNKGLSHFNLEHESFINFDSHNGIIFDEMAINASYQNEDGELFFGTANGLVIFNPDSISSPKNISAPVITKFEINYEDARQWQPGFESIRISPEDKVISFEFASLNQPNPHQMVYEFMVEGIDQYWIQTPASKRTATYSTLPYGENLFKVRVRNQFGVTSSETIIKLDALRPFWLSWWFLLTIIILVFAIVAGSIRAYYIHRLRMRLRKHEITEKVHEERERISRDLHDTVGTQLTHIISSLDNITYQSNLDKEEKQTLETLSDFARTTMQFLRETIWVINKNTIGIGEFIDRISDYTGKISSLENISISVVDKTFSSYLLHQFISMNLLRIIQEGIANSVKHSQATNLDIVFNEQANMFELTISDNGKGFEAIQQEGHYGLKNIHSRIIELEGTFEVESSAEGTTLHLCFPK